MIININYLYKFNYKIVIKFTTLFKLYKIFNNKNNVKIFFKN